MINISNKSQRTTPHEPRTIMHIDMNSYFATVEQQANPCLRGKPVGVKGSEAKRTIMAAASIEAKKFGVKTGMRVQDALELCPELILVVGEPRKYSSVTEKFIEIFGRYTDKVEIFSIDEAFLDVTNTSHLFAPPFCHSGIASWNEQYPESRKSNRLDPRFREDDKGGYVILRTKDEESRSNGKGSLDKLGMTERGEDDKESEKGAIEIAKKIKSDIRKEIGEWVTCSVGIAPNKFLAKLGSGLEKPDGLVIINDKNKDEILLSCQLTDFCGIAGRIEKRLNMMGIYSVKDLREADDWKLRKEFGVYGLKLKNMSWGRDSSEVLDWHEQADAKSFGHSRTLNKDVTDKDEIMGQLYLLSEKVAKRMRDEDYFGKEVGVWIRFKDFTGTGKRHRIGYWTNDGYEIYKEAMKIVNEIYFNCHSGSPIVVEDMLDPESRSSKLDSCFRRNDKRGSKPIRAMGVYVTRISKIVPRYLFDEDKKKEKVTTIMDKINNRFGEDTIFKGTLLNFPFKKIVSGMGRKKF